MDEKARAIQLEILDLRAFCERQSTSPYNNRVGEKHVRQIFADVATRLTGSAIMLGQITGFSDTSNIGQRDEVRSELTAVLSVLDRIVKKVDLLYPDQLMGAAVPEDEHG